MTGLVGEGEGDGGAGAHEEDEAEKKAKFQARQKKLRELRSQHRRNTRKLLENTKKVDEVSFHRVILFCRCRLLMLLHCTDDGCSYGFASWDDGGC